MHPRAFFGFACGVLGGIALAQCPPEWDQDIGAVGADGNVRALASFDDGAGTAVYVAGEFFSAGDVSGPYIARWRSGSWESWNPAANDSVRAMLVWDDDGAGPHPPALYVGGWFTNIGGVAASFIARFDGAAWHTLGVGVDGAVYSLVAADLDGPGPGRAALFAGGQFGMAGGSPAARIAKWDGTNWTALGSQTFSQGTTAFALATFDEDGPGSGLARLVAGGDFFAPHQFIIRWSGSEWEALGGGMSDLVLALLEFDDGSGAALYAGGSFTNAGTTLAPRVARYRAGTWEDLAGGMTNTVRAFSTFDDGTGQALFTGGSFATAGGNIASNVALWRDGAWSEFGGGVNSTVRCLATLNDGTGRGPALFVGGQFFTVNHESIVATRIARWGCNEVQCPADFDGDGFVTGLDFDAFVADFEAGLPSSDFDGDGFVTGLDFDSYVVAFEEGC